MEVFSKVLHTDIGQTVAFTVHIFPDTGCAVLEFAIDTQRSCRIISCGSSFAMLMDYTLLLLCFI